MSRFDSYMEAAAASSKEELMLAVIDFLSENPHPKDEVVHALAEKMGVDPDQIEEAAYAVLGAFLGGGKSKGKDTITGSEKEMAHAVEREHVGGTGLPKVVLDRLTEKIGSDHDDEYRRYYQKLAEMEKTFPKQKEEKE